MRNTGVESIISDCNNELERISHMIEGLGSTNAISGFLTKYALMQICGTLERSYKILIADHYKSFSPELEQFINNHVLEVSMNACYDNICRMLKSFDAGKSADFKNAVHALPDGEQCITLFKELNDIRNNVVHGGTAIPSFTDLRTKYQGSVKIIEVLDRIM